MKNNKRAEVCGAEKLFDKIQFDCMMSADHHMDDDIVVLNFRDISFEVKVVSINTPFFKVGE